MSLALQDISLAIEGRTLLSGLSLTIADGETVSIMGPSGCGKSSLLGMISGSLPPTFRVQGSVTINGQEITGLAMEKRGIGLLFQDDLLFPHLSVAGNLAFALPWGLSRKERQRQITQALADARLSGYQDADPASLSGGQRARISLMRTLLSRPRVLLLDEPFSRLDRALRQRFRDFVFSTVAERNIPTLLVTHDHEDCNGRVITLQPEESRNYA